MLPLSLEREDGYEPLSPATDYSDFDDDHDFEMSDYRLRETNLYEKMNEVAVSGNGELVDDDICFNWRYCEEHDVLDDMTLHGWSYEIVDTKMYGNDNNKSCVTCLCRHAQYGTCTLVIYFDYKFKTPKKIYIYPGFESSPEWSPPMDSEDSSIFGSDDER